MKPKINRRDETTVRGSIRSDELLDLRTFGRRLGLGDRALCDLQKDGLQTVVFGRRKYLIGRWVIEHAERKVRQQTNGKGQDDV